MRQREKEKKGRKRMEIKGIVERRKRGGRYGK